MKTCEKCVNYVWGDNVTPFPEICIQCKYVEADGEKIPSNWKERPLTNGDRIRAMKDAELGQLLSAFCKNADGCNHCPLYHGSCAEDEKLERWIEWLQQPVKEEA